MSQHRIELTLAGQKFAFATSPEHETSLRAAAALVDEQLESLLTVAIAVLSVPPS